jgi:integrase
VNGRKSTDHVKSRLARHLTPVFQGRRLSSITTTEIRAFVAARKQAGASNGEVNRELAILRRMFTLARQAGKITDQPHVPMLHEDNARRGFFERAQFESVRAHLPAHIRPVVTFAYLTGWRVASEILPLQWRQVDFEAREVRLDPGTTKNREGRTFPFTAEVEALLLELHQEHEQRKTAGQIVPWVFHRDRARIKNFRGAWITATKAAGCPGSLVHDFRRTAVRNLERAGVSRSAAMAMVGHKTESIYRRYAIVDASVLRKAAEKIDEAGAYTRRESNVVGRGARAVGA